MQKPGTLMELFKNQTNSKCPFPLLDRSLYDNSKGHHPGRYCGLASFDNGATCCFPCPIQDWIYPREWVSQLRIPSYLGILSVVLCCFLLLSFAILPPNQTHRHYLSVGLLFPVLLISLSFAIPATSQPDMCHDAITPNDMRTSMSCALTGSLVVLGGIGCVIWAFLRSLWVHVRLFWDRDPGHRFKWGSIIFGTVMPVVFLAVTLVETGFSYRMSQTCLPNHKKALVSFWVWLVIFSGLAFCLQSIAACYCFLIYLRSHRHPTSGIADQRRRKYQRKLFMLQWRNILVSILVTVGSISFFVLFWTQDSRLGLLFDDNESVGMVKTWLSCQALSEGNRDECEEYIAHLTIDQSAVLTSLILASLVGIEVFILLFRKSMISAWLTLFRQVFNSVRRQGPSAKNRQSSLFASGKGYFHSSPTSPSKSDFSSSLPPFMSSGADSFIPAPEPVLVSVRFGDRPCEVNDVALDSSLSTQEWLNHTNGEGENIEKTPEEAAPIEHTVFSAAMTTEPMPTTRRLSQIQPMPSPTGEERSYIPTREAPMPPRRALSVTLDSTSNNNTAPSKRTSFRNSMGKWRSSTTPTVWEADNVRHSGISLRTMAMIGDQEVRDVISAPVADSFVHVDGAFLPQRAPGRPRGGPLGSHPVDG